MSKKYFIFLIIVCLFLSVSLITKEKVYADDPFPSLKSPWETGNTKSWTVGLHGPTATGYCQDTTYDKTYAVDFSGRFDVLAAYEGTIIKSENIPQYGNVVRIKHNNTWATEYVHLESRSVQVNDQVIQGQVIGISGHTGNASGDHLHFALLKWGVRSINGEDVWDWYYETWNDKVIDGWRIHEVRSWGGTAPLYAEATATQGDNWQGTRSAFTDAHCGTNKDTQTWLSDDVNNTKVSSATIVANDKTYNNASFPSTNVRQETNPCGGSNVVLEDMTIGNGESLECGANNSIQVKPNFHAQNGSYVRLKIE